MYSVVGIMYIKSRFKNINPSTEKTRSKNYETRKYSFSNVNGLVGRMYGHRINGLKLKFLECP